MTFFDSGKRRWSVGDFGAASNLVLWIALFLIVPSPGRCDAQQGDDKRPVASDRARSFRDRVTDRISLKDGTHLFGMAVSEKPAKLVVRTVWLEQQLPDFFNEKIKPALAENKDDTKSPLATALQAEIDKLDDTNPDEHRRASLLNEVRKRLVPDAGELPPFIFVEVGKPQLRSLETQKEQRRELCRLAILNDLRDYEDAHWKTVTEQLQSIPEQQRRTALNEQQSNTDEQLQQVLAAVDHQLGTVTRLVQSGGEVFEEGKQLDFGALMSSMMGGNVQSLLNELLNEGGKAQQNVAANAEFPAAAKALAEKNQHDTVSISSFDFNLEQGTATVNKRLFRKAKDGSWKLMMSASGQSSSADLKPGQADEIANDPQIKEIAGIANGLGIGGNQLETALSMGAVVRNAMNQAENNFVSAVQSVMTTKGLAQGSSMPTVSLE